MPFPYNSMLGGYLDQREPKMKREYSEYSIDRSDDFIETHGERLHSIIGSPISAIWLAWDLKDNEWWTDEAIIINLGKTQLEIFCWRLSDIIMTWDMIDITERPNTVADWPDEISIEWRKNPFPFMLELIDKRIISINIIEFLFKTKTIDDRINPENIYHLSSNPSPEF